MNNAVFSSMRSQMVPSLEAQTALRERLEEIKPKGERTHMWKYLAAAACVALALCAYPAYNALRPAPALHSYVLTDGSASATTDLQGSIAMGVDKGEEEGPNTGDLPGGAYIGDVPVQPGADAYQLLMNHFGDALPDWYGGAYLADNGTLMVLLVNDKDPGDKTLELKVLDVVGRTAPVGFAGVKYSRNDLERMNEELLALLEGKGLSAAWGIYDEQNRIVLEVSEPLSDDLLAALAKIDPEDDAILVCVTDRNAAVLTDLQGEVPTPIGEGDDPVVPGGLTDPAAPGGATDLPQSKQPAVYDIQTLE